MKRVMLASSRGLVVAALALSSCVPGRTARYSERVETSRKESDPELLLSRGHGFAHAGDHARAAQYLQAALQQGADPDRVLPLLVTVEIQSQGYRSAARHLAERLRSRPSDVRARFVLASLLSALDRPKDAERELLSVLSSAPRHAEATYALAVVYRDGMSNFQKADDYFRRYLDLEPQGRHREEAMSSTLSGKP